MCYHADVGFSAPALLLCNPLPLCHANVHRGGEWCQRAVKTLFRQSHSSLSLDEGFYLSFYIILEMIPL